MSISYITDPLAIATEGFLVSNALNVVNTLAVSVQGFLVTLVEEIVEVPIKGGSTAVGPYDHWETLPKKKKKRITATLFIDGVEYKETIELDDIEVTVNDIKVEVQNSTTPKIPIS